MIAVDPLLVHLTAKAKAAPLEAIPWPAGLAPVPASTFKPSPDAPLPDADAIVVFWTVAEAQALADVLTPGVPHTKWIPYRSQWANYQHLLTGRSPAHEEKALAHYWLTTIGTKRVLVVKSELHLATDNPITPPVVNLWKQMIADAHPKLVITGGTAGGIGVDTQVGDVFVVTNAKFNCTKGSKSTPWAQTRYGGSTLQTGSNWWSWPALVAPNADALVSRAGRPLQLVRGGSVETVDYFAFADATDSFGVVKNDPDAHTEEMDDATLPLALFDMDDPPAWCSIRCASDPQVPAMPTIKAEEAWAEKIYVELGYPATLGCAIAAGLVIADQP